MFLSKKFEAFMTVVENGSLSKAAKVMNRTTPPIAKSIKDFECTIGKKLFKREKFGMRLTNEGTALYHDLKNLYQQEKEITKKYLTSHITNTVNIYYDWGKERILSEIFKVAETNNIHTNIFRLNSENINDIPDYYGNMLILTSEKIICERFSLLKEVQDFDFGIYARKDIINKSEDVMSLLHENIWLCNPALFKSQFIKSLEERVTNNVSKVNIRQIDNTTCCLKSIHTGRYICITNSLMDDFDGDSKLAFVHFTKEIFGKNNLYFYKSKSHSSVLNKIINYVENVNQ